jgi:CspA family cold shock protein
MSTGSVNGSTMPRVSASLHRTAGGKDLFAHFSAIQSDGHKSLRENQKVSYDVTTGPKGDRAANIKSVD